MNAIRSESQYCKWLTHTCDDVYEESWQLDSSQFPETAGQNWRIKKRRLQGGKQDGVDVVEVNNGKFAFTVIPTRGMNILKAEADGIRLGWDSPVNEIVNPCWINVEGRGGTGFLEGFNELVARCGLENTGAPCTDAKGSIFLPLHGRISNIPASSVWIEINWDTPCRLTVGGMVRETRMFGPSYLLTTRIITTVDSTRLEIIDEVTNLSSTPKEMELLYHINFGHPVLKDGARLCAPVEEVSAADEWALNDIDSWDTFGRPEPGRQEQCYFLKLLGDANSNTMVGLVDTEKANAVFMEFCIDQLPCFTLWKNTASLADGYVTGLEPGTDYPNPRPFEREKGRVVTLDLDEHYNACLALELASGREEVENFIQRIEAIGGSHKAVVHDFLNPEFSALT